MIGWEYWPSYCSAINNNRQSTGLTNNSVAIPNIIASNFRHKAPAAIKSSSSIDIFATLPSDQILRKTWNPICGAALSTITKHCYLALSFDSFDMVAKADYVIDTIIEPPPGWEIIAGGSSGRIERKIGTDLVVKVRYPNCLDPVADSAQLRREFDIYQALPRHDRLLSLLSGSTPERLLFPYLAGGMLKTHLETAHIPPLDRKQRLQLATDAAEAISVIHAHGVVHCDIQPSNFMLNGDNRLCVIDFAGSRFRDEEGTALESVRYYLPRAVEDPSSVQTDLFALGSVLYTILTGAPPYEDKTDDEVTELYTSGTFPSIESFTGGEVVLKCWTSKYESAQQVYEAIKECSH